MTFDGKNIGSIYFLGIGGIGMSALARCFQAQGARIMGYDKTPTRLTEELEREGMSIHYEDEPGLIPPDLDMVIYTPAIPKDLGEFIRIRELGLPVFKRAEVLGRITHDSFTIAVAGTHGKTTITSMIAHILYQAGKSMTAMMGGISKNYGTNFLTTGKGGVMVVEADEYDRSFLQLRPDIAVISSMDADHLDIYESREGMLESFAQFAIQVKPAGRVILKAGLEKELPVLPRSTYYTTETWADFSIKDVGIEDGRHRFTILGEGRMYPDILLQVPGRHNIENALAAAAVCSYCNVSPREVVTGLNSWQGVKRRFDIRLQEPGKVYIDDYAHHPGELDVFIRAVRELYPGKKITGIFQPHLYSRTRDFAEGFAASLDMLDETFLLDIYPAREKPIPGISSEIILKKMKNRRKKQVSREELLKKLDKKRPEVLLTIGAGDIDLLTVPIENMMKAW